MNTQTIAEKAPVQKYKGLKFKTAQAFAEWVKQKCFAHIQFVDNGQDLTEVWVDEDGEILHSDLQSSIWCSQFIRMNNLFEGAPVEMWTESSGWFISDFIVEKIIA